MAWAVAELEFVHLTLLESLSSASLRKITQAEPLNLRNTAWAFSALGLFHATLWESISSASIARISALAMTDLTHMAWAVADRAVMINDPLMDSLAASALNKISAADS